ncbi:hypothetical protein DM01DRAFT_1214839 [Hesseltinella vesiculosa]|uniref:Uncharacterized protein n=1 Tax=Hesseltinella vesiculosa TaxID=101127 RepID=A0A1X2G286_9FUNG|nr:hypothetical protein DM01DRAFT_1214839 [Hesseltinella vesiculosa]
MIATHYPRIVTSARCCACWCCAEMSLLVLRCGVLSWCCGVSSWCHDVFGVLLSVLRCVDLVSWCFWCIALGVAVCRLGVLVFSVCCSRCVAFGAKPTLLRLCLPACLGWSSVSPAIGDGRAVGIPCKLNSW